MAAPSSSASAGGATRPWGAGGKWEAPPAATRRVRDALLAACAPGAQRGEVAALLRELVPAAALRLALGADEARVAGGDAGGAPGGERCVTVLTDGRARPARLGAAHLLPVRAIADPHGHALELEVALDAGGALCCLWLLTERTALQQTVELVAGGLGAGERRGASAAATCTWRRVESAGERAEAAAAEATLAAVEAHLQAARRLDEAGVADVGLGWGARPAAAVRAAGDVDASSHGDVDGIDGDDGATPGDDGAVAPASPAAQSSGETAALPADAVEPPTTPPAAPPTPSPAPAPPSPVRVVDWSGTDASNGKVDRSGTWPPVRVVDWSGTWRTDHAQSDSLEPFLKLLGVGYLARKLLLNVEVTSTWRHDVGGGTIAVTDKSIVTNSVTHELTGETRSVTDASNGKVSQLSAAVLPLAALPAHVRAGLAAPMPPRASGSSSSSSPAGGGHPADGTPLGALRLTSVLPDGMCSSVDYRVLLARGRLMRQFITHERNGESVALALTLVNGEWSEARAQLPSTAGESEAPSATAAPPPPPPAAAQHHDTVTPPAAPPTATAAASVDHVPTSPLPQPVHTRPAASPPPPPTPLANRPLHPPETPAASPFSGTDSGPDPFFVCMTGAWAIDAPVSDSLEPLWQSLGLGWLRRSRLRAAAAEHAVGAADGAVITIQHTPTRVALVDPSLWHLDDEAAMPLDATWVPASGGAAAAAAAGSPVRGGGTAATPGDARAPPPAPRSRRACQLEGQRDPGPSWLGPLAAAGDAQQQQLQQCHWPVWLQGGDVCDGGLLGGGSEFVTRGGIEALARAHASHAPAATNPAPVVVFTALPPPLDDELNRCVVRVEVAALPTAAQPPPTPSAAHARGMGTSLRAGVVAAQQPLCATGGVPHAALLGPLPCAVFRVDTALVRRSVLQQTLSHVAPDGRVLVSASRLLRRVDEAPQQRRMGDRLHAARLKHAHAVLAARRAGADAALAAACRAMRPGDDEGDAAAPPPALAAPADPAPSPSTAPSLHFYDCPLYGDASTGLPGSTSPLGAAEADEAAPSASSLEIDDDGQQEASDVGGAPAGAGFEQLAGGIVGGSVRPPPAASSPSPPSRTSRPVDPSLGPQFYTSPVHSPVHARVPTVAPEPAAPSAAPPSLHAAAGHGALASSPTPPPPFAPPPPPHFPSPERAQPPLPQPQPQPQWPQEAHAQLEPRPRRDSEGSDASQASRLSQRPSAFRSAGVGPQAARRRSTASTGGVGSSVVSGGGGGGGGGGTPARPAAAPSPVKAPSSAARPLPVLQEVLDSVDIDD